MGEKKFLDEVTAFSLYDITGGAGVFLQIIKQINSINQLVK